MQAVGTIAKLAENVIGRTVHAVIHPLETLGDVAGTARRAAATVVSRGGDPEWRVATEAPAGMPDLAPPLPPLVVEADDEPGEAFHTEPKGASRDVDHGGPGDDSVDDWEAELEEAPDLAVGEHPQPDTAEGIDASLAKEVRAEAAVMKKASDVEKE